jgi:hypothetical protein
MKDEQNDRKHVKHLLLHLLVRDVRQSVSQSDEVRGMRRKRETRKMRRNEQMSDRMMMRETRIGIKSNGMMSERSGDSFAEKADATVTIFRIE